MISNEVDEDALMIKLGIC